MVHALHHRPHGQVMQETVRSTLWAAGVLIAMLLLILVLFLGVFAIRAL
jgi:hypothetical protein